MFRVRPSLAILRRFLAPATAAVCGLLVLSPTARGQSASNIVTFDAPGAGTGYGEGTMPSGMNSSGVIVGWVSGSNNRSSGFLRRADGSMTIIRVPGANDTQIYGINDSGTMVGTFDTPSFATFGFLRTADGKFTYFRPTGTQFWEGAIAIDNVGNVAGTIISTYDFFICYIRTSGGAVTTFNPPGGFDCEVNDIVAGTVSGTYSDPAGFFSGFLRYPDGTYTVFPIGYQVNGAVLNSEESAAGSFYLSDGSSHGYIRSTSGAITYFDLNGAAAINVRDINSAGTITGSFLYDPEGSPAHAFQRSPDGTIQAFDAPGAGTGQFQGTSAVKINDAGTIAGGFTDSNNVGHGFVLTP